jgi:chaperonin GroES
VAKFGLKPLSDKVVIERMDAEAFTPGGLVLPDTAKEKPKRGTVRAVGPGRFLEDGERSKMQVQPGNQVLFTSYAGTEIEANGSKFIIMNESDILAIIE